MAVAKRKNTATLRSIPVNLTQSILNTPITIILTKLMYVVLLASFLLIGYLFGKLQSLEKNNSNSEVKVISAISPQPTTAIPTPPPNPKEILQKLSQGHLPQEGDENAKVTIIEFSDFECPFCANYFRDTLPKIRADYIETGKVKVYYRHLPLAFHPLAKPLAIASECANDQGKFWQMHDKIFENHDKISTSNIQIHKEWALELGLDPIQFNNCVDNQQHVDSINEDAKAAAEVGITGTPGFFVNGRLVMGAQPYEVFKSIIDEELAK